VAVGFKVSDDSVWEFGFLGAFRFHFAPLREKNIDNFSQRRKEDPKAQSKLRYYLMIDE